MDLFFPSYGKTYYFDNNQYFQVTSGIGIMCMNIHYIISWSKLDHIHSFRLRLVYVPCCPNHIISSYYHLRWVFIAPFSITYLISNPTGENTLHQLFLYMPKYYKSHTLLKLPYYHVLTSPLYYHGPLIKVRARVSE